MLAALLLSIIPTGEAFTCTPTHVWDGDGPIWCEEGPRIRLAGIAAREIDGVCNPGHPCPEAGGVEARDTLVALVGRKTGTGPHGHVLVKGPAMQCVSEGRDRSRTVAWCSTGGADLSCSMVQSGKALRWPRYKGAEVCRR